MATAVQLRRGTTAQNDAFTGALGEVSVDTTLDTLRVHDASTQGGFPLINTSSAQSITGKTFTGTTVMAALDISGNVDIDGTLEADAITINSVTLAETISDTVGAMVSSNTESGIAVAYQDADNTLDFTLGAAQTTINSILATDLIIGEDAQTAIDFGTADEIDFKAANAVRLTLAAGALRPQTNNQIDLGTSSLEFKDAFFDGTVTSDAFAGPLTGNVTGNASGSALTVTQAAQSAITSLGTLTTLTVDNVIINGTTIGHTGDTDLITVSSGVVAVAGEVTGTGFTGTLDGILGSGTAAAATVTTLNSSGAVNLNLTTDATNSTSGALIIDGGVGVAKKLFVGTDLDVDGTANLDVVDIDGAVNMALTALVTGVLTTTATQVATGGITSGAGIVSDTDGTDDLGTTSVRWRHVFADAVTVTDEIIATGFTGTLDGILGGGAAAAATVTTLNSSGAVNLNLTTDASSSTAGALIVDGGVAIAKKLFVGTNFDVSGNSVIDGTALVTGVATFGDDVVSDTDSTDDLGTTGVRWANLFVDAITATDQITATGFTGTLDGALGSGAAATAVVTTLAATTLDTSGVVNLNLATDSTSSTSGALIVDGGVGIAKKLFVGTALDVSTTLVVDGASTLTGAVLKGATATEHGAGAVATSFAPVTRRSTSNGVITTKIHFDLTGLGGKGGTANDVIGLPAGGNAFIGKNVVGTNGVIYRAELACIELAAAASGSATVDIDVATNTSGTIAYDGAGGTAKLFNTGGMVAGQELNNITPAITADDFFYLVEGDTAATDGVYSGGQFVLTLYGHAVA